MTSPAPAHVQQTPARAPRRGPGRFTRGPIMRHVAVMTLSGTVGLTLMFLVDAATLLYIAMLGDPALTAAVGYAWSVQFFIVAVGLAISIAATALVARALGARDAAGARRAAGSSYLAVFVTLAVLSALAAAFRFPILSALGAEGEALEAGAAFLLLAAPSMPLMGLGMASASILRAAGDAGRAMLVTTASAAVSVLLDPILIFEAPLGLPGAGWGIEGAALAMTGARMASCSVGLWGVVKVHDLCARPSAAGFRADLAPLSAIAGPAVLAQLSAPFANVLLTRAVAPYGDDAMAGWAVTGRLTVLAFGGVFALGSALGGIFGQNYGAGRPARVQRIYRDGLIFCAVYVLAAWGLLALLAETAIAGFGLPPDGAALVRVFAAWGGIGFLFAGGMIVASAAFNTMGRPVWATGFNWARDGAATALCILLIGAALGPSGAVWAQIAAQVSLGVAAVWLGGRFAGGPLRLRRAAASRARDGGAD